MIICNFLNFENYQFIYYFEISFIKMYAFVIQVILYHLLIHHNKNLVNFNY